MTTQLEPNFDITTDPTGKTRIVFDPKKAEAKLDLSTRAKRRKSKRVRVGKKHVLGQRSFA